MDKIRVYINTVELSVLDLVSINTLGHQCDNPEARISAGMRHASGNSSGLVSDEERKTMKLVEQFAEENGFKYEIVDLSKAGSIKRLKFILKGWKTPVVTFENEAIVGLPTKDQLKSLVRR